MFDPLVFDPDLIGAPAPWLAPSLAAGLYGYLAAGPVLSVGTRVYPVVLPQGAQLPAVVYQVIPAEGPLHSHSDRQAGAGATQLGYRQVRVQFGCWAHTYAGAEALSDELVAALDGYSGTWGELAVGHVLMEGPQDDYDPSTLTWRRLVDAMIGYQGAGL